MKIAEVNTKGKFITLERTLVLIKPKDKSMETPAGPKRMCKLLLKDSTGTIDLVLWEDKSDQVMEGDIIKLENAYTKTFQDKIQLTLTKWSKIEVLKRRD